MATTNLNIRTDKAVKDQAEEIFSELGLNMTTAINLSLIHIFPEAEVRDAVSEGWKELAMTRLEMQKKGEEVLKYMEEHHRRGIVLALSLIHI